VENSGAADAPSVAFERGTGPLEQWLRASRNVADPDFHVPPHDDEWRVRGAHWSLTSFRQPRR
jgi:hypothetical protein